MTTSNYKIAGHLPNAVGISQGIPRGWKGRRCKALAPPWALVKEPDPKRFNRLYGQQLAKLDPAAIAAELGPDAILLCWEKPGDYCHRRIVAKWLEKHLGIKVPEYEADVQAINTPQQPTQPLLSMSVT